MKERVYSVIKFCIGKSSAMTVNRIASRIGIMDDKASCPRTRAIIKNLIKDGYPIGSCHNGYFMITSKKEMDEYICSLAMRIDGIQNRIDKLKEIKL